MEKASVIVNEELKENAYARTKRNSEKFSTIWVISVIQLISRANAKAIKDKGDDD